MKHRRRDFTLFLVFWNVILILFNFDMSFYLLAVLFSIFFKLIYLCKLYLRQAFFSRHWERNMLSVIFKRDEDLVEDIWKKASDFKITYVIMNIFGCVSMNCDRPSSGSRLRFPTSSVATPPATEPLSYGERERLVSVSVMRTVSQRIQNTRSHIPLCLQFIDTQLMIIKVLL